MANTQMLYGESERHLFALVQSGAIQRQAGETVDHLLEKELGPINMQGAQPMQGSPDQLFLGLEHQLRSLVQAKALSEETFGSIYAILAEERGGNSSLPSGAPWSVQRAWLGSRWPSHKSMAH